MNAQSKALSVEDIEIKFKENKTTVATYAHGPYHAKILRNWVQKDKGGLYTQQNGKISNPSGVPRMINSFLVFFPADSYAFFALAKWVEKQIKRYVPSMSSRRVAESDILPGILIYPIQVQKSQSLSRKRIPETPATTTRENASTPSVGAREKMVFWERWSLNTRANT